MLSFRIALRYLFSKKSHRAVNIISAIAIAGVAVATMAIVVVLSVFNGFSRLSTDRLSLIDADLRIEPKEGKTFRRAGEMVALLSERDDVAAASAVIEERAMLVADAAQLPVEFKAVDSNYDRVVRIDSVMIDGIYLARTDSIDLMQLSVGVANRSGLRPGLEYAADLYVPRRKGRINAANPAASLRSHTLAVSGVMEVDQAEEDNDRVIIPLAVARELLEYEDDEATAVEIAVKAGSDPEKVAEEIAVVIGEDYTILDRGMQQADSFRMIQLEKWVTFMMLVFILLIASFNIISTLSLLVAEKRSDSTILRALGMSRDSTARIFRLQGLLITLIGGAAGIVIGIALALLQQHFGLIKLAGDPSALTISVYPVAVEPIDVAAVAVALVVTGIVTSQLTRLFTKNIR